MNEPMKTILVAGGAGYVGSHFCHVAAERGFHPVIVDRIEPSSPRVAAYRRSAAQRFPLEICDIGDEAQVDRVIAQYRPIAAVCFAALIEVAESVADPDLYWKNNFVSAGRFFGRLAAASVRHLVFSSTAAVYGPTTDYGSLAEGHWLDPANPYGHTKLACELTLQGTSLCHNIAPGVQLHPRVAETTGPATFAPLSSLIFRYFNAAGAYPCVGLGEVHDPESHLIPRAIAAALHQKGTGDGKVLTINGDDYATKDGTCVRDYVHVLDLAEAHVLGLEYLLSGGGNDVINLGSGSGYSVYQVLASVEDAMKVRVPACIGPRRAGDPTRLVADVTKAQNVLGWRPRRGLGNIIELAVEFHQLHA